MSSNNFNDFSVEIGKQRKMAKKKDLTLAEFIAAYMNHLLTHREAPHSVYSFCTELNTDESNFYAFFGSFEGLRKAIYTQFHTQTVQLLEQSEDFKNFNPQNKLLTYYYTLFDLLAANRSYVYKDLIQQNNRLQSLKILQELKSHFTQYIKHLDIPTLNNVPSAIQDIQQKSIEEAAWIQFLSILKFWLNDNSPKFEKTDVMIEKAIKASFDLIQTQPVESVIDFGKFWLKEAFNRS